MDSKPLRIILTTGDPDGIGLEITRRALKKLGPQGQVQFLVLRSKSEKPFYAPKFKSQVCANLGEALQTSFSSGLLLDIASTELAPRWVEQAAFACQNGLADALVTGPLSKTSIIAAGLNDIGHTEILKRISKCDDLFMGFIGKQFSVLLATGHMPTARALGSINESVIRRASKAAFELREIFDKKRKKRPVAWLGINPHAGESGLIGKEELMMQAVFRKISNSKHRIVGPLVPDTAFLAKNWKTHSVYVCPYHDQGLIPFKMIHGFKSGVHITMGLPFVRTSVDHGTAKDLYGKKQADYGSMKDALVTAIQLCRRKEK